MNIEILEFLEEYKNLDELCKQILSSDKGISEYIDEMEKEYEAKFKVSCWEKDYKRLKKMRWIRNKLVHEPNSFSDELIHKEDIEWLHTFRSRILECSDPYSLLYRTKTVKSKDEKKSYIQIDNYAELSKENKEISKILILIIILILFFFIISIFLLLK